MPDLFEATDLWPYLFEIKCDASFLAAEYIDIAKSEK